MSIVYTEALESASAKISEALLNAPGALLEHGFTIDRFVKQLMCDVGRRTMAKLYFGMADYLVQEAAQSGFEVHENPEVAFKVIFGAVQIRSPYLHNPQTGEYQRPLRERFGVEGGKYSEGVQRALVDFGSEKSFDRASRRFEEHYGWEVGRTTVRRRTLDAAFDAEEYLRERLKQAEQQYNTPPTKRPVVGVMIGELDGCEIRTGIFMTAAEAGRTDCEPDKIVRVEKWREVRTGLVHPIAEVDSTYICRMAPYPEVCRQLFAAACERGLSSQTQVVSPGDGGIGLMEAMATQFERFQYILDRPHLGSHWYETADALGLEGKMRERWVRTHMHRIDDGAVHEVINELQTLLKREPNERLERLIGYLTRFAKAVHYSLFKEREWPIGSGEVESAHRYIPQERLKLPGAWWHPDHVNPMLALRVIRANQWWNGFWAWRAQRRRNAA